MVIVFRDKMQMIHKPHGLLQTRMQFGAGKGGGLKFRDAIHQTGSRRAKLSQNLSQLPAVVIGFMSFSIAQVRDGERVVNARAQVPSKILPKESEMVARARAHASPVVSRAQPRR